MTEVLIRRISPARAAAFDVLEEVEKGAYASDTLLEKTRGLTSRDAGLASQIVFGCLRFQGQLDYLIEFYSGRPSLGLDGPVLIGLRAAIFQLRYLERIPAHASVHESVEFIKARKRAASGFANAVLRKVNRAPVLWPDAPTELSCPSWLFDRWAGHFGAHQARAIALAALKEPERYIRVPPGCLPPDGAEATEIEGCYLLPSAVPGVRLHDISSQTIIPLLDLRPEHAYLDLCSAPGNKTLQALEYRPKLAVACDVSFERLREVPTVCPRVVLDGREALPFNRRFDRIFIDAPCSGTGTLARNPEIKWRVSPNELRGFQHRQIEIVARGLRSLAPAGKLLYATCSLETEENEEVIRAVRERVENSRVSQEVWRLPGREGGDGFYAAVFELGK